MSDVTVVTGIYGGYDVLKQPPEQDIDVEWFAVTDNPHLEGGRWKVWPQYTSSIVHPRYAAKVPKCMPWLWVGRGPVIWVDGSFTFRNESSVRRLLEAAQPRGNQREDAVSQFVHPNRDCIFTEANFSKALPKYVGQPVAEQAIAYRDANHPESWGLWATGLIVYPQWSYHREELGMRWLTEQLTWTNQDQISQPYVWWLRGDRPRELPGSLLVNEFVELHPHQDGT